MTNEDLSIFRNLEDAARALARALRSGDAARIEAAEAAYRAAEAARAAAAAAREAAE